MSDFAIHPLHEKPERAEVCAAWSYGEWSAYLETASLENSVKGYKDRAKNKDKLPLTWLGYEGKNMIGMVSLKENCHEDYKELTPWLGSLFVHPYFRRKGYGSALIQHIHAKAKEMGFHHLHLFTSDKTSLYEKNGWKKTAEIRDPMGLHDTNSLMEIDL